MDDCHTSALQKLRTPKTSALRGRSWYRYYAGFSSAFVNDVCDLFSLRPGHRVLDPWMGSGTTLSIAARRGCFVNGLDLNPVMSIVAKGRLLAEDTRSSIEPLLAEIIRRWYPSKVLTTDMLSNWFTLDSAALLRGLARRIDSALVIEQPDPNQKADRMSSLAAFFYVALFETVTCALKTYRSRNPTWIKRGSLGNGDVVLTKEEIGLSFNESVMRKLRYIDSNTSVSFDIRDNSNATIGDSRSLPFSSSSCDAVITSPPYLTRLDYVIGHLPELAVLGFAPEDVRSLRDQMIGTPTMGRKPTGEVPIGGRSETILKAILDHGSYAAASYYEPVFRGYFDGIAHSLSEIARVCRPSSQVALVVQDSWFKNIHIDLAAAIRCMAIEQEWIYVGQKDFRSTHSMAQLNPKAHQAARTTRPIESVLVLQTPSSSSASRSGRRT